MPGRAGIQALRNRRRRSAKRGIIPTGPIHSFEHPTVRVESLRSALRSSALRSPTLRTPALRTGALGATGALLLSSFGPPALAALQPAGSPTEPTRSSQPSLAPPPWQLAPADAGGSGWLPVPNEAVLPPEFRPIPANFSSADLTAQPRSPKPSEYGDVLTDTIGIFGLGGGLQVGGTTGDRWAGVITTRVGYKFNDHLAISLRPSVIFGNSDLQGKPNSESSFQMPLTLDLFRSSTFSPYFGVGIATNTDSTGYTDPMITGGVDINFTRNITLGLNVNYIFQNQIGDTDWAAMSLLYFRF